MFTRSISKDSGDTLDVEMWSAKIFYTFWGTFSQPIITKHGNEFIGKVALNTAAVFGVFWGVYFFLRGFRLLARKRLIQNIPASKVRSACLGQVEISGKAAGPYTILSPLSQSECFYYKATIGDAADRVESLCVPFFVEDDTGRVMVDLRGAECQLPATFEEQKYVYDLGECAQHFASRHGFTAGALVRVSECCVQESDSLFILGTLAENPGDTMSADIQSADITRESDFLSAEAAAAQRAVMLEMMAVPTLPLEIRSAAAVQNRGFDLHPTVILKKGTDKTPFVISRSSVKQVVQDLGWKSFLYIWGGPILALLGIAVLLNLWLR